MEIGNPSLTERIERRHLLQVGALPAGLGCRPDEKRFQPLFVGQELARINPVLLNRFFKTVYLSPRRLDFRFSDLCKVTRADVPYQDQ